MESPSTMLAATEAAAEELNRDLHISSVAVKRLEQQLTQHLADYATGAPDNGRADILRQDIVTHLRVIKETPDVITELHARAAALHEQVVTASRLGGKQQADEKFFTLLQEIIAAGEATPASITALRKVAASSNNPARKFDIDRLEIELDEHDRRIKQAGSADALESVFTFQFQLEEQQSKRR